MARILTLILAASLLACIPSCSPGGADSRNKDLDRPKSADEKPADLPRKEVPAPKQTAR